jgi:integrase
MNQNSLKLQGVLSMKPETLRLKDLFRYYLNQHFKANNLKRKDIAESNINNLKEFFTNKTVMSLTRQDIRDYLDYRWAVGVGNATIAREIAVLSKCLHIAVDVYGIDEDFILDLKVNHFKPKCKPRKVLPSVEEIPLILKHLPVHLRRPFFAAWRIGYRLKSEILSLKFRNLDLEKGVIMLEETMQTPIKNGFSRITPLDPEMITFFKNMKCEAQRIFGDNVLQQYIFRTPDNKKIQGHAVYRPFRTAQKRCGMIDDDGKWLYRPHDFRRAASKWLLQDKRKPEKVVCKFYTGHKDPDIFRKHYDIESSADLDYAFQLYHNFIGIRKEGYDGKKAFAH